MLFRRSLSSSNNFCIYFCLFSATFWWMKKFFVLSSFSRRNFASVGKNFCFLFVAAYVKCKKKYSFSRVVFLFFFSPKLPTLFYSDKKQNDSCGVRTTWFWSGRERDRVPILPNIFTISNRDTPSLHPSFPYFFFDTKNFVKHNTEGFPYKVFRYCETTNFRRKILIPSPLFYP